MKVTGNLLIGVFLGILLAALLAIIGMPYIVRNTSFLLGFAACLFFVLVVFSAVYFKPLKAILFPKNSSPSSVEESKTSKARVSLRKLLRIVVIILVGVWGCYFFFKLNEWLETQKLFQQNQLSRQTELFNAVQRSSSSQLMSHVLGKIDAELKANPARTVSNETIAEIAALCYGLKPYHYPEGNSLSERKLSPERGQLLLMLLGMNLDTGSLSMILKQASFAGADLRKANLNGAYLIGADLKEADLREADLKGAQLENADLSFSNAWGADMTGANLRRSVWIRSEMKYTILNQADLEGADLTEVELVSARLRKANLRGVKLEWSDLSGALLEEADMTGANLYTTIFTKAQCANANFSKTDMTSALMLDANLTGAIFTPLKMDYSKLTGAEMTDAIVGEQAWLTRIAEWNVTGAEEMQNIYTVIADNDVYKMKKK